MIEIESSSLTPDLIPSPDAGWEEIFDFAQTFDGYKRYGSDEAYRSLAREDRLKTLDELRATLFFLQRAWHWQVEIPEGEYLEEFKVLVEAIREKVVGNWFRTNKIMTPYDSRAIAQDIGRPPFTKLPFEAQLSIRRMFGKEIMTMDEYLIERDKLVKKYEGQNEMEFPVHRPIIVTKPFADQIKEFTQSVNWTYASTMPEWPHEYIVRYQVDKEIFLEMVRHIREYGYLGSFYEKRITYFNEDGKVYWTMGESLEKTIVINRCREEDTYEARKGNGTLPEKKPN